MARLPQNGGDSGSWGSILNDFLLQSHQNDGTLKSNSVGEAQLQDNAVTTSKIASGVIQESQLSGLVVSKLNAPAVITDGSIAKAKLENNIQVSLDKADTALQTAPVASVNTKTGIVVLSKNDIGLNNVDNVSDSNKPISTLMQAALDSKYTKPNGGIPATDLAETYINAQRRYELPVGLGWDTSLVPLPNINTVLKSVGLERSVATLNETPQDYFTRVSGSTVLTSPGATFYVSMTAGSDSNPGTAGAQFKSIWKAIQAANSAGVPTKIIIDAATTDNPYWRTNNAWYAGGTGVFASVDIALLANNGRVCVTTADPQSGMSPQARGSDATYPNCAKCTVASVNRVVDTATRSKFGTYVELTNVSSAALCNSTPNSWFLSSNVLYINRADGATISNTNTRIYRPGTSNISIRNPINVFIGGNTPGSGFDFEGSSNIGVLDAVVGSSGSPMSVTKTIVATDSTFRYGGGIVDTTSRGVSIESWNGPAVFFGCETSGSQTDGFNFHNTYAASNQYALTINCAARDNGRIGQVSCNGHTLHENCKSIDICGYYDGNHGGTIRNINASKCLVVEPVVLNDLGDRMLAASGVMDPTGICTDNTAEIWVAGGRVDVPIGGWPYYTRDTSTIRVRDVRPTAQSMYGGVGTFTNW